MTFTYSLCINVINIVCMLFVWLVSVAVVAAEFYISFFMLLFSCLGFLLQTFRLCECLCFHFYLFIFVSLQFPSFFVIGQLCILCDLIGSL